MPEHRDDFYIGYKPQTTPGIARRTGAFVIALFLLAFVVGALLLAPWQNELSYGVFEFGNVRPFEGRLAATPYPVLHVEGESPSEPHLLVDFGKSGVTQELEDLDGKRVRAHGQLIYSDEGRMIELAAPPIEALSAERLDGGVERSIERVTLVGEIVDSKCFLGVMKPGEGKPHRSCAARCISGGVPPALLVKIDDGSSRLLLLTDDVGEPLGREILGLVAQPVSVTGTVAFRDGLWYLWAAPSDIQLWQGERG